MAKEVKKAEKQVVPSKPTKTISDMIVEMRTQIRDALPATGMTPERLARIALTAIRQNPKLGQCSFPSILGSLLTAAQMGLEPNTPLGQCYMIPRRRKVGSQYIQEAQFQMGYQGLLDLAYRSGRYSSVSAREVYMEDEFDYHYGMQPNLFHRPAPSHSGNPVFYYAIIRMVDGSSDFLVMSREDIVEHAAKFSDSFSSDFSPWVTSFDAMAKKTVIASLLKYAQKSPSVLSAIQVDGSVASAKVVGQGSLDMTYSYDGDEQAGPVEAKEAPPIKDAEPVAPEAPKKAEPPKRAPFQAPPKDFPPPSDDELPRPKRDQMEIF